jgi:hypothetical protein
VETGKPYPSDVADGEWAFAAPYLTLLPEGAGQPVPETAKANYSAGPSAVANMATVWLGTGGPVCVVGQSGPHLVIDVAAYIR